MTDKYILKTTLIILGFLFAFIFILTVILDKKNRSKNKIKGLGEYWLRYITFIFLVPIFLIPAYIGKPVFNFLVIIMAMLYLREYFDLTNIEYHKIYRWQARIFAILILLSTLSKEKFIFFRLPILIMMIVIATPVFLRKVKNAVRDTCITIVGVLYFGWMFSYAVFLRDNFGFGGIVFVSFLVTINDIACFWVGKFFGKNKLIPEISPNKTIEGSLGGIIFTVMFSIFLKYTLYSYNYIECMILGATISICGQIGDLVLSVIKRDMQVKDSGKILPGHGGMLDRFTSWVFTLPIVYYLLYILKLVKVR